MLRHAALPFLLLALVSCSGTHFGINSSIGMSVATASLQSSIAGYTASDGKTFLVLVPSISSINGARDVDLDPDNFEIRVGTSTYHHSSHSNDLDAYCTRYLVVPSDGASSCNIAFEVPAGVSSGVLRFEDFSLSDFRSYRAATDFTL